MSETTKTLDLSVDKRGVMVVTYRWAYVDGEINLCDEHANSQDAGGTLGPVQYGAHRGECAVCAADPEEQAESDE